MNFSTISVIGLGYIGLPTAAAFASRQKRVVGVDINQHAVETINRGEIHIVEPDLASVVKTAVEQGYLSATTAPVEADAYLIAVPTPFKDLHEPDMVFVESAAKSIAPTLKKGSLVILESTSPVGSTEQMAGWLAEMRPDLSFPQQVGEAADVNIAYCPERVLPGQVMVELIKNDRVIGGMSPVCSARASELKIACFGLAFKPNIDDLRESPAMAIAAQIARWHGGETLVVEPNIHQLPKKLDGLCALASLDEALASADVLVMLVDHKEFKAVGGESVSQQFIVDTKGVWR